MRLMNNANNDTSQKNISFICKTIIDESKRLEKMVTDAAVYSDMYEKETDYSSISVKSLISAAIDKLNGKAESTLNITIKMHPDDLMIEGDAKDLELLFTNIFNHCLEITGDNRPDISISAAPDFLSPFVEIEILNKGLFQKPEEIQNAFVPFYASNPDGTGFGLSIARLAARKSLGDIYLESLPEEGMRYLVKLPVKIN